jgi:hypothetical protein
VVKIPCSLLERFTDALWYAAWMDKAELITPQEYKGHVVTTSDHEFIPTFPPTSNGGEQPMTRNRRGIFSRTIILLSRIGRRP